ncbi:MAG: hypothetical protein KJ569_06680 [Candidatus Omnitrophica bacterium]|nr:hypothetical protein [Candidatus Omnitrophota bacterium]
MGKSEELEKLTGSLLVDSSKIRSLLGCLPAGRQGRRHSRWKWGLEKRFTDYADLQKMKDKKTNIQRLRGLQRLNKSKSRFNGAGHQGQ